MGLFDSSVTYTAYAGSSVLIPEEDRQHTVKSLMLQSIVGAHTTIAESIKLGLQTDMYARAKSMVRYSERSDGYYYGLPEATHNGDDRYLPIAVLMHDKVWWDDAEIGTDDDPLEITTKRLLKRLAIDPYELKEEYIAAVEEAIASGERPGAAVMDEWDVFVHFAVPMHSRIRGSREYIYQFLKFLPSVNQWTTRANYESYLAGGQVGDQPSSNFHLSEGEGSDKDWQVTATGYEVYYAWSYIDSVDRAGEYTPPGWDDPLRPNRTYSKIYQFGDEDYSEGIEEVHGAGAAVATSEPDGAYHDYAVFTHQYLDGEVPRYEQVIIMAPSMMYVINTPSEGENQPIQYIPVELFPDDPQEDSEFRWPIHISTLKEVGRMRREEVLQDALCTTVFLVEKQQVKWYQKGFFKWLIIIIAVIVVILTYQYQLLGTVSSMASAAFAAGATATAIAYAALYVAMTFAIGFLISFAGSLIGGEFGQIFVLAAMLYLSGGLNIFSNISQAWTQMGANLGWGSATNFLQAIGPVVSVGRVIIENRALGKLEAEMRDFVKTAREKYEELEDAWDEFGESPSWLNPLDLTAAFQGSWYVEQPENYIERSLNANPGVLGYDLINRFSELALTLPEDGRDNNLLTAMFEDMERQRGAV